ncbi:hypothetical protein HY638_01125 [Candidatus Woesearchaeota archaeon]|nr:hypothetical protein [Candidatus Woesearchaeota archaeon]
MVEFKKEELLKLKPDERLKKLRDIEEKEKKEIKEIGKLIKKSQQELIEQSKVIVDVPPITEVDISHLFGVEEGIEGAVQNAPFSVDFDVSYLSSVSFDGYEQIAGYAPKTNVNLTLFIDTTRYRSVGDIAIEISSTSRGAFTQVKKYGIR